MGDLWLFDLLGINNKRRRRRICFFDELEGNCNFWFNN